VTLGLQRERDQVARDLVVVEHDHLALPPVLQLAAAEQLDDPAGRARHRDQTVEADLACAGLELTELGAQHVGGVLGVDPAGAGERREQLGAPRALLEQGHHPALPRCHEVGLRAYPRE